MPHDELPQHLLVAIIGSGATMSLPMHAWCLNEKINRSLHGRFIQRPPLFVFLCDANLLKLSSTVLTVHTGGRCWCRRCCSASTTVGCPGSRTGGRRARSRPFLHIHVFSSDGPHCVHSPGRCYSSNLPKHAIRLWVN
jgi:hypothetical protein